MSFEEHAIRRPAICARCQIAETVKRGQFARLCNSVESATVVGSAKQGCSIEIAIAVQYESHPGLFAVGASRAALGAEVVYRRKHTGRSDFENHALAVGAATRGCTVEVAIGSLDKPSPRV